MSKIHISSPLVLKGDIDPTVAPGAAAPVGCLFQNDSDGRLWTKVDVGDTDWSQLAPSSSVKDAILTWGCDTVGAATNARFLPPGHDVGMAPTTDTMQIPITVACTLGNLFVRHNSASGNGQPVTYTVMVNGVATAIACSLATGAVGQASDTVNTVAVVAGDRVSLRATKAAVIDAGVINVQASLGVV